MTWGRSIRPLLLIQPDSNVDSLTTRYDSTTDSKSSVSQKSHFFNSLKNELLKIIEHYNLPQLSALLAPFYLSVLFKIKMHFSY